MTLLLLSLLLLFTRFAVPMADTRCVSGCSVAIARIVLEVGTFNDVELDLTQCPDTVC